MVQNLVSTKQRWLWFYPLSEWSHEGFQISQHPTAGDPPSCPLITSVFTQPEKHATSGPIWKIIYMHTGIIYTRDKKTAVDVIVHNPVSANKYVRETQEMGRSCSCHKWFLLILTSAIFFFNWPTSSQVLMGKTSLYIYINMQGNSWVFERHLIIKNGL